MIEILFALFVALQLADFVTTLAGLKAGHSEGNPILSRLFKRLRPEIALAIVKLLIVAAMTAALLQGALDVIALVILSTVYAVVVLNNVRVLRGK